MSKINQLSLDDAVDPAAQVAGWDQTIADKNHSTSWEAQRVSIASHALAYRTVVCGTTLRDPNDNKWTTWKRSFAPHRVCRVACNKDGSIVAAAIDNGTVAVLKGTNGDVLASRRVASAGVRIPAEVSFVRRNAIAGTQLDTLVVEPPEANVPTILVSHIDGKRLNNGEDGIVEDAVKSIVFHELKIKEVPDSRAIQGYYRSKDQVRFALVDGNGNIAIHDYNIERKLGSTIAKDVSVGSDETDNWGVDFATGLRIQHVGSQHSFLVFAASSTDESQVGIYDLEKLKMARSFAVSENKNGNNIRTRVLALEPVTSSAEVTSLAMVVATTSASGKDGVAPTIETRLIQASVDEINGKIGELHPVYYIPVPNTVTSMSIAPLPDEEKSYAFRCLTSREQQKSMECHEFIPNGSSLGSIRLLARTSCFQQASVIVSEIGSQTLQADPFARFHPSEIALQELYTLLSRGPVRDSESARLSKACLDQLSDGALSGNIHGKRALLSAADAMLNWPDEEVIQRGHTTLWDVVVGMQGIVNGIKPVCRELSESSEFDTKISELEERLVAMQYLQSIMGKSAPLNAEFASILSVKHLFECLVQSKYFSQAEQLWRSTLQPKLSTEVMITSMLGLPSRINPREYASLLSEVVIPSLSINHELLPPLLEWSCRMADDFDDAVEEDGLENAIFLLEILERGTKELRVNVHSSFAAYTPFVDTILKKKRRIGPKNSSVTHNSTAADLSFSSVKSNALSQQSEKAPVDESLEDEATPAPTLLEFSTMRRGAQKARARRHSSIDTVDESEDCVESKLVAARCLKYARELGLERKLISLRTYSSCGGAQFIAKDLVRLFSRSARDNKQPEKMLASQFQSFCRESSADADEAIKQYSEDLCGGNMTTRRAVDETASLSQCCVATKTKCEVVLITLRAAKFCHYSPQWISKLSLDAIEWAAGDSALRSELEEASRLLLIDGIVGRYCGDAAKELFHVDNPRHAIRLVEFMSHQHSMDESVLSDSLALCDAFGHLSKEEVCSRIIQNRLLEGEKDACSALMEVLYRQNSILAKDTFSRVISFCIDVIEEGPGTSSIQKIQVANATSCAFKLSKIALTYVHSHIGTNSMGYASSTYDESRLQEMVEDFRRLELLQAKHGIFLSFVDLNDPKVLVANAKSSIEPLVELYVQGDSKSSSTVATRAKRICSLLSGSSKISFTSLWLTAVGSLACKLAKETSGFQCLEFLSDTGVLESLEDDLPSRTCLALALTFCGKALKQHVSFDIKSRMKFVVISNSLLRDLSITRCSTDLLAAATATAELCDMTSQILVRADEGVGEQIDEYRKMLRTYMDGKSLTNACFTSEPNRVISDSTSTHRSSLHPSWYVGDGLLLPPSETLERGLEFCKKCLARSSVLDATASLYTFLEGRGAHSLALRLLTYSTVMGCQRNDGGPDFQQLKALAATHTKNLVALTERSLGGSGNGILSGVVDSQLSGSFLLCLPLKKAFKVYKSALPTAMSTRDFERLIKLASIGQAIGTSGIFLPPDNQQLDKNWKRQQKFVSQCRQLALRAKWWKKLQFFDVQFDLYRFDQSESKDEDHQEGQQYPETLLPSLISKMTEKDVESEKILMTTGDFAEAFGLSKEIATKQYIQYLLSPVENGEEKNGNEVRSRLSTLQALSESLIQQLASPLDRLKILRGCYIRLEASSTCQDYERLSIILSLYRMELNSFLLTANEKHTLYEPATIELELVGRRLEALALLSSFMQVEKKQQRPTMDSLFRPLPVSLDQMDPNASKVLRISILGSKEDGTFDPLRPLEDILTSSCDKALSTLSPLCPSLGVPNGYLHARTLILQFKKSKLKGVSYPSFEGDVLPVLQKLKSPDDVADLAEWCSKQYTFENEDKLRSLDSAKNFAVQASIDAEKNYSSTNSLHESEALDRLKRIRSAKELLVDRLAINAILTSVGIKAESFCTLSSIIDDLTKRLDEQVWSKSKFDPEKFVEIFLTEASLLSAEACLCNQRALSVAKFRKLCALVHQACKSVAERYSHVHVGTTIRKLAKQWLAHGDNSISSDDTPSNPCEASVSASFAPNDPNPPVFPEIMQEEEDTVNFVMDLSSLKEETVWSANIGPSQNSELEEKKYTSEEEPSSLKFPGSSSEVSDFSSRRTALRIAFVMAFTDGYEANEEQQETSKENLQPKPDGTLNAQGSKRKGKTGLLAKIGQSESEKRRVSVIEHSRDLLRVVFAKPGSSESLAIGSFDGQKTVTFAMRHRALRAASILCPQQALEEVVDEEGLLTAGSASSLKRCSFAAYIAKEIEELGLPLPHSDLSQLSTINFSSYARTLWRHHRDNRAIKGRLLLLIVEMYLKEPVQDYGFLATVLSEVEKSNLPRSLLLILESTNHYLERMDGGIIDSFFCHVGKEIMLCLQSLEAMISMEYNRLHDANDQSQLQLQDALATSKRMTALMKAFSRGPEGQQFLLHYIQSLLLLSERALCKVEKKELLRSTFSLLKFLDDSKASKRLAEDIRARAGTSFSLPLLDNSDTGLTLTLD